MNFVFSSCAVHRTTFTCQLWTSIANLLGITLHQTTSNIPAANGMVERFQHTPKATLMSHCKDSNWFTQLPWFLLGLKTASQIVYGDPLVVPVEFVSICNLPLQSPVLTSSCMKVYSMQPDKPQAKQHMPTDLHLATPTNLQNDTSKQRLMPPYSGSFFVTHRTLEAFFINNRGKEHWITIDCLKPAYVLPLHCNSFPSLHCY
ncbi:uncharacterized protein [Palaemon carinicauda]|uniref:uncharacterized protein n=1 Tax=Palaemon carinicauda TaxID=392227 RepID=UPI0035B64D9A